MKPNTCAAITFALAAIAWSATAATLCVSLQSTNPVSPYADWDTAATNIQDAVDAANPGDTVLVTNGVYQTGACAVYGMSNRVAVTKPVTVQTVNGPLVTTIVGSGPNGPTAVRCVYLTNAALLAGFTLTNGATQTSGDSVNDRTGGGVWCQSTSASVSNCVISGNMSAYSGGGVYSGTLTSCILSNNAVLQGRGFGGGSWKSVLNNCTLTHNSGYEGGGACDSTLNNCLLTDNSATYGGGAFGSILKGCTIVSNSAGWSGGGVEGDGPDSFANNCIVYYNSAPSGTNWYGESLANCCTFPLPGGAGNITNAPIFIDLAGGDFRLQSNSPCINTGRNAFASGDTDLDGNPRIIGGTVDIGAYECQSPALLDFYSWLQTYGLDTGASATYTDSDNDGLNNWQEWITGTDPTNAASALSLVFPQTNSSGLAVTWQSVTNRTYFLDRATDLSAVPAFLPLATNIPGQPDTTTFTDTNAIGNGPFFYRVGVQP